MTGKYRWTICALLFATTVNYLDRAVISLVKEYLGYRVQLDQDRLCECDRGLSSCRMPSPMCWLAD
jgi:hypothetical protein